MVVMMEGNFEKEGYYLFDAPRMHQHKPGNGKRYICPEASGLLNPSTSETVLESVYRRAEKFHNGGGNLKSIEEYLNRHMDETLDRQGMTYFPPGSTTPLKGSGEGATSVTKAIIEEQKALDVKQQRGGYDQRQLPGHFQTSDGKTLKDFRIDVLEPFNQERWDAGLGPIATDLCQSVDVIRNQAIRTYEDKYMCSYQSLVKNKHDNTTHSMPQALGSSGVSSCDMMSIGSNGQWGFEEQVVKETPCITHTFDCTVKNPRKPDHPNIHFYPYCIANENKTVDGDRQYVTYHSMIKAAGLTKPPLLFKMDVEGFEFDVMTHMLDEAISSGSTHLLPLQISVELHYATRMFDLPWKMRTVTAAEISMFMAMMYNRGGYVPVHYQEIGPGCFSCAELLFVRIFCD